MWGLELGRHGNDKNEERCKQGRRRESNGEIRLRAVVGMGDDMKEKKRVISKSGNP